MKTAALLLAILACFLLGPSAQAKTPCKDTIHNKVITSQLAIIGENKSYVAQYGIRNRALVDKKSELTVQARKALKDGKTEEAQRLFSQAADMYQKEIEGTLGEHWLYIDIEGDFNTAMDISQEMPDRAKGNEMASRLVGMASKELQDKEKLRVKPLDAANWASFAAGLAERAGMKEQAKAFHLKAAKNYLKAGNLSLASKSATKAGISIPNVVGIVLALLSLLVWSIWRIKSSRRGEDPRERSHLWDEEREGITGTLA